MCLFALYSFYLLYYVLFDVVSRLFVFCVFGYYDDLIVVFVVSVVVMCFVFIYVFTFVGLKHTNKIHNKFQLMV